MAGLVLLATLAGPAAGQWLEETIYLPDEFGGLIRPTCLAFDTVRNKVYYGGGTENLADSTDENVYEYWIVVTDAATLERVAHVQVPGRVAAICFNPVSGKIYCALDLDEVVCVIDCATDSLVASIEVGERPTSMCFNPDDNKLYCANKWTEDVSVIDGTGDAVLATIPLSSAPKTLCYASANNTVYCGDYDGFITLIDGQGDSVRAVLGLGPDSNQVDAACWNPQENKYYCLAYVQTDALISTLHAIDGYGDSLLTQVSLGRGTEALCYNTADNRLYCVDTEDSLWVVDCAADTVEHIIQLPEYVPGRIVCSPRTNRLYCLPPLNEISHLEHVMVVDCIGDSFLKFIQTGGQPEAMGYDPIQERLHCLNHETGDATVVDCAGDSVLSTVGLGCMPEFLAYASNENKVYCAGQSFGQVIAIDGESNRVVAEIPLPGWVAQLCYNPVLSKLYCADTASDTVTVIDCTTDRVVARIGVGRSPRYLAFSPAGGSKVYCSNTGQRMVSVIDCVSDSVIASVGVRGLAQDLLVNTRESKVYCNTLGDLVSVIDCEGDTFAGVCNVSGRPLAYNPIENKVYVGYDTMFVMDGATDSVVAVLDTVEVHWWNGGCYNDRNNKAYVVASVLPPYLMVIDGATDTVIAFISDPAGGSGLFQLYYNRTNNKVYIVCYYSGFVLVFDGAADSILGTVAIGAGPRALAWNPIQNRTYVANWYGSSVSVLRDSIVQSIAETPPVGVPPKPLPTIIRNVLNLQSPISNPQSPMVLMDACGRRVLDLHAGENDISHLSPGVYFWKDRLTARVGRVVLVN